MEKQSPKPNPLNEGLTKPPKTDLATPIQSNPNLGDIQKGFTKPPKEVNSGKPPQK